MTDANFLGFSGGDGIGIGGDDGGVGVSAVAVGGGVGDNSARAVTGAPLIVRG